MIHLIVVFGRGITAPGAVRTTVGDNLYIAFLSHFCYRIGAQHVGFMSLDHDVDLGLQNI